MALHTQGNPRLNWHFSFLGKIYAFSGWLGILGGFFLLLSLNGTGGQEVQRTEMISGMPMTVSIFLLFGWSAILLSFSKDILGPQKWTTGIGGWLIGAFHLISVPIGTAIGTYTLWILFHNRR